MATTKIAFELTANGDNLESSVKEIKSQLKQAQAEADNLADKFGATSKEAQDAAHNVQQIGDQVSELNEQRLDDAAKTVSALSATLGGLQGALDLTGTASEETAAMLAKIQGALSVGDAIQNLAEFKTSIINTFTLLKDNAIKAFQSIKGAIGSTGIGLLVLAVAAIYTYWDDIKAVVSGVSEETKQAAAEAQKKLAISEQELKSVDDTSEILKLQGKSERDILKIKLEKIKASIADAKVNITIQEQIAKSQLEAEKRNYNILRNIARFSIEVSVAALRVIAAPIDLLIKSANGIAESLGFGKIAATSINEEITKLTAAGTEKVTRLLFDPEKTAEKGQATIDEAKAKFKQLENEQAGYQNKINDIDKQAAASATANSNDAKNKLIADAKELRDAKNKTYLESIKDEDFRAREQLRLSNEALLEDLANSDKTAAQKKALKIEYEKQYEIERAALLKQQDEKAKEKAKADLEKQNEIDNALMNARLAAISDENYKKQLQIDIDRQAEIDKQADAYNKGLISLEDYNKAVNGINITYDQKLTDEQKAQAEERIKIAEEEAAKKIEATKAIGDAMGQLSEIIGAETAVGKSLAIAQATINTWLGATEVLRAKTTLPEPIGTISKIINVAAIVTSGIKSVKSIIGTKVPGGGGGGGVPSMPSMNAPLTPQLQTTSFNQGQINQLASATTRAFVLESDVSGNQERIRRINRAARIN